MPGDRKSKYFVERFNPTLTKSEQETTTAQIDRTYYDY